MQVIDSLFLVVAVERFHLNVADEIRLCCESLPRMLFMVIAQVPLVSAEVAIAVPD